MSSHDSLGGSLARRWSQPEEKAPSFLKGYEYLNGVIKYHVEHLGKEVSSIENKMARFLQTLCLGENPEWLEHMKKFQARFGWNFRFYNRVDGLESDYSVIVDPDDPDTTYSYCFCHESDRYDDVGLHFFDDSSGPSRITSEWFYERLVDKLKQGGEDELHKACKRFYRILESIRSQVQEVMDEFQSPEITDLKLQLLDKDEEIADKEKRLSKIGGTIVKVQEDIRETKSSFKSKKLGRVQHDLEDIRKWANGEHVFTSS